jgi:hypothetical protein
VDSVDLATLHTSLGVSDIESLEDTDIPGSISKSDLLSLVLDAMEILMDNMDESDWDAESDDGVSYSSTPSNLFSLDDIPENFSISGSFDNVSPLVNMFVNAEGEADVTIRFSNENLSRLIAEVSLSDIDIEIPALLPTQYSSIATEVSGGRFIAAANANFDLSTFFESSADESELSSIKAALALSIRMQAALSFTNPNDYDGNVVLTFSYDEEADIDLSEDMVDDETADSYLDDALGNGTFTLSIAVYDSNGDLSFTVNYSISDIIDWAVEA